ncbi:MAG: twin-arginine translocation signal domain-containing protein [Opitutales bacterium]|nr:twin-arginine translocation signal domain-containing protein [Opitutales bacterium]
MKHPITRRSFVKTTGIAAALAPFIPSMGANVGYPDAGTDHRVELLWHPSARFGHRNQCAVF